MSGKSLKSFPDEFIDSTALQDITLPGKALIIGGSFFGSIEILTTDGSVFMNVESHLKAKYIIYSNRNRPLKITIPEKETELKSTVEKYENYLDQLIKQIEADYKKNFPGGKDSALLINNIFKILNLIRY
ncbi:MAG: hypothetical protein P4L45_08415 [Ignavibacteriaceae bacterium]|nr:hypothetical protein [Ignavibacteriaceae bacterium]